MANGEKQSHRLNFYIGHKLRFSSEDMVSLFVQTFYSPYNIGVCGLWHLKRGVVMV